MRLFIAIDLPDSVKEYLKRLQAVLPEAEMGKTRDFHLTLKFLGECEQNLIPNIENELNQVVFLPFTARLNKIGIFGGRRFPRVVWVGMEVSPRMKDTVADLENKMKKFGFEKENRFVPHITLAKIRTVADPESFLKNLGKIKIEPRDFPVSRFHLFSSRLSPNGAKHTILKSFPRRAR